MVQLVQVLVGVAAAAGDGEAQFGDDVGREVPRRRLQLDLVEGKEGQRVHYIIITEK